MELKHLNFGWLHSPPFPPASCHCMMIRSGARVLLIDTGIGLQDIADPEGRIGKEALELAGFQLIESMTAARQLEKMGIAPSDVTDIVLTHCDHDHVGGLADFPSAKVHISEEELQNLQSGNPRFNPNQFAHQPNWQTYKNNDCETVGIPSRKIQTDLEIDIRLVPLFGHTKGHCGVAIVQQEKVTLHVGDAYYLRDELSNPEHPVGELATIRAEDNSLRIQSLDSIRKAISNHANLDYFGYHDITELPSDIPSFETVVGEV